jgi:DNA-binding transcriptional LysR family regulator
VYGNTPYYQGPSARLAAPSLWSGYSWKLQDVFSPPSRVPQEAGNFAQQIAIAIRYDRGYAAGIELRHLRYFVAVAEELSFTKAAERLRLAQPSLTRQVRNLEDEIEVTLLDRSSNRVALTNEGRQFLLDAKKLLALVAESVATVQRMKRGQSPDLNIGYVSNIHYGLLPATLGAFRKLCPGVALNLFDMTVGEQFLALDSRKIDLGFVGLRPLDPGRHLLSECVGQDTILVAIQAGHTLAKKASIKLSELASHFFICMSPKTHPGAREWLTETCRKAGFAGRILQEAESETTVIQFVVDGLGVALLPEQITGLPHDGVIFRALSPPLRRESTVAWRADNSSKALKDYVQIVKDLSRAA